MKLVLSDTVALIGLMVSMLFRNRERSQFVYSMIIIVAVGISFFLDPSLLGIIARLATGGTFLNMCNILIYLLPLILIATVFPLLSKKIISSAI